MVDDFSERLDQALIDNGLTNARAAELLDPRGQQKLNAWRNRGRVGTPSERAVAKLLPLTNMTWLQHGTGGRFRAEAASGSVNEPQSTGYEQSLAARLDTEILAKSLLVLDADEEANGEYGYLHRAEALVRYYEELVAGGDALLLIAKTTKARSQGDLSGEKQVRRPGGPHR